MEKVNFTLVFKSEPEGGFTVIVPSLPGCVTYGKDLKEAKTMAIDAIKGYLVSLEKHRESIPSDESVFFTTINLKCQRNGYVYV